MAEQRTQMIAAVATMGTSLLLTCIVAEVAFRIFAPDWLEHRMEVLENGDHYGGDAGLPKETIAGTFYRFTPDSRFELNHYEYQNVAHTDEYGGRRTGRSDQDLALMVPFMGDSFTFGVGVEDDETYVSILEENMPGIRFLNLGVPGSALPNQIDIIELRHEELGRPPFYVFSFFIGNDFSNIHGWYNRKRDAEDDDATGDASDRSLLASVNHFVYYNPMLKKSYLLQFVRQKVLILVQQYKPRHMEPIFRIVAKDGVHLENANKYLLAELRRLDRLSEDLDFGYLFLVIPDRNQVSPAMLASMAGYYDIDPSDIDTTLPNRMLARDFALLDIPYVDLTACLKEREDLDTLYYVQDNHFTAYGHRAAAACTLSQLRGRANFREILAPDS